MTDAALTDGVTSPQSLGKQLTIRLLLVQTCHFFSAEATDDKSDDDL